MIQSLSNFVVRTAELAEAEGRVAKIEVMRLAKFALAYGVAALLTLVGVTTIAAGICLALIEVMHPGGALAITGILLLIGSGAAVAVAQRYESRQSAG